MGWLANGQPLQFEQRLVRTAHPYVDCQRVWDPLRDVLCRVPWRHKFVQRPKRGRVSVGFCLDMQTSHANYSQLLNIPTYQMDPNGGLKVLGTDWEGTVIQLAPILARSLLSCNKHIQSKHVMSNSISTYSWSCLNDHIKNVIGQLATQLISQLIPTFLVRRASIRSYMLVSMGVSALTFNVTSQFLDRGWHCQTLPGFKMFIQVEGDLWHIFYILKPSFGDVVCLFFPVWRANPRLDGWV